MKFLYLALAFALGVLSVVAWRACATSSSNAEGKTVLQIPWDSPYALKAPESEIATDSNGHSALTIQPLADGRVAYKATLFRISNPPLGHRFALEGTISYVNLPDNSAFDLTACYLRDTETATTDEREGPGRQPRGSSPERPFIMTFNTLPGKGPLLQLDLTVYVGGKPLEDPDTKGQPPKITLSNLHLVDYPEYTPAEARAFMGQPELPASFDGKSFSLGMAAAAVLGLAMAQAVVLVRRLRKLRADHEMRQMASLDG